MTHFGKGCPFVGIFDGQRDDADPVLTFCDHRDNTSDTEGNCNALLCPLHLPVVD